MELTKQLLRSHWPDGRCGSRLRECLFLEYESIGLIC